MDRIYDKIVDEYYDDAPLIDTDNFSEEVYSYEEWKKVSRVLSEDVHC